jgi:hypothetical protein
MGVQGQLTQGYQQGQALPGHKQKKKAKSKRKTQAGASNGTSIT